MNTPRNWVARVAKARTGAGIHKRSTKAIRAEDKRALKKDIQREIKDA